MWALHVSVSAGTGTAATQVENLHKCASDSASNWSSRNLTFGLMSFINSIHDTRMSGYLQSKYVVLILTWLETSDLRADRPESNNDFLSNTSVGCTCSRLSRTNRLNLECQYPSLKFSVRFYLELDQGSPLIVLAVKWMCVVLNVNSKNQPASAFNCHKWTRSPHLGQRALGTGYSSHDRVAAHLTFRLNINETYVVHGTKHCSCKFTAK